MQFAIIDTTLAEKATRGGEREKFFSLPAACRLFSCGVIFTRARVSLALLSLRKNGGLLVVYCCSSFPLPLDIFLKSGLI